ncbi:MAG: glycosyltransferase [Lacibacter sp.]
MKRILIISPHFPPVNAPDMQRVRMSLPYYREMGWEAEVICVHENYTEGFKDELLNDTLPVDIPVHKVKAFPVGITRKIGLGSLSLRSYYQFKKRGTALLKQKKFDLVFFSTAMFHVCALGKYWKKKFGVPFIVDMQDPWRNDFHLNKPVSERPPKFLVAYTINKWMEAYTMPSADGLMSVSQGYIDELRKRYPALISKPAAVIPFGSSERDYELVQKKNIAPEIIHQSEGKINVVYAGAVTKFFLPLLEAFFKAFHQSGIDKKKYHFYFIGTNYAAGAREKPVEQLAANCGMEGSVTEVPRRISYFSALATLIHSDILFIPGSTDADYNASKVYNNILSGRPIFSIFHERSLVKKVIEESNAGVVVSVNERDDEQSLINKISARLPDFEQLPVASRVINQTVTDQFSSKTMTGKQVELFNRIVS